MLVLAPNNVRFRSVVAENHEKDDEEVVTTGVNAAAGRRRPSFVVGDFTEFFRFRETYRPSSYYPPYVRRCTHYNSRCQWPICTHARHDAPRTNYTRTERGPAASVPCLVIGAAH